MALIEVRELEHEEQGRKLLSGISLCVEAGERIAILGGNRSGKSALAWWLAGWLPTDDVPSLHGSVLFQGRKWKDLPLAERAVAVQLVGQIPLQQLSGREFTVRDEIAFGPGNLRLPLGEVQARTDEAIARCGLEALAHRDPYTLSGGEQQMVVLAGAFAMRPSILVLDEPVASLDPRAAERVLDLLNQLPVATTVILVDTSPRVALRLARRFLLLNDGRCLVDGSAEAVILHPQAASTLGLPAAAEAARLAQGARPWKPGMGMPLTVDAAVAAFQENERAGR